MRCALLVCFWIGVPAWAGLPIQSWTASTGARVLFVETRSIPMLDIAVVRARPRHRLGAIR